MLQHGWTSETFCQVKNGQTQEIPYYMILFI
jgi:hypothetical protein